MQEWYLGREKVSCLERCPQFRGVPIESSTVHVQYILYCTMYCVQGMLILCLCRGRLDVSPSIPDNLPDGLRDFLHKCLHPNELLRLPAHELLLHPFITPSPSPLHPRPHPPPLTTLTHTTTITTNSGTCIYLHVHGYNTNMCMVTILTCACL